MSSPSSQQSNPPDFRDNNHQVIIASKSKDKDRDMSDEEVQLLSQDRHGEEEENVPFELPIKTPKRRYTSAPFIWFALSLTIGPLVIIIMAFVMEDADTPFSLAFVMGLITCILGACYFIPHLVLKEELDSVYTLNQKKRFQTEKIHKEIKSLTSAVAELSATKKKIVNANKETKKLLGNLQVMNVESVEELNESKAKAQKLYQQWHTQLLKKERILLHTLFDRFEFMDGSPGMDKKEYLAFCANLPDGYVERMERMGTFEKLSKGDGIIDYQEFKSALDVFAEMEINDEDIDFEITKQETGTDESGNKQYVNSIIKKSTQARRLIKNKWFKNKSVDEK